MTAITLLVLGILVVVVGILWFRLHAFLALLAGALLVAALTPRTTLEQVALDQGATPEQASALADQPAGQRLAEHFGRTCGKIGILIAMAAIIGRCLLESGAADRIVRSALQVLGESRAPAAFMGSGFLLAIPVYFDTVFYLMMPLGKSLAIRTGRNYALYVMSIIAGGTMAHSLVPPTPGPLLVASELDISLGAMIVGGLAVGLISMSIGYGYARWVDQRWPLPLRDDADISLEELTQMNNREMSQLPPLGLSLLPILLPLALITGDTLFHEWWGAEGQIAGWQNSLLLLFEKAGNKNLAMIIGAASALALCTRQQKFSRDSAAQLVQQALLSGGMIILITSAGGAFGAILRQTGIGSEISQFAEGTSASILPLAFGVTVLIRCAQGSATVAMITTVGMFTAMSNPDQLGFHPVYLALAIGCGSKPFPWMNDSGFWIISRLSGMTVTETLRNFSVMISLMGFGGLIVVMIGAHFLPLI